MRHGKKVNHLGRKSEHRKAMLSNMACSLIEHKRISTTVAKAKALRVYVEPLITKSKTDSTHSRRTVFSYLKNKEVVSELFRDVAPKVADRPGGYTRIIRTGFRLGDNAEMCMIELVDFNELMLGNTADSKKTTRRSRRGGGGAKATTTSPAAEANSAADEIQDAVVVEDESPAVEEAPAAETTEDAEETTVNDQITDVVEDTPASDDAPATEGEEEKKEGE